MRVTRSINFQQFASSALVSAVALSTALFTDTPSGAVANALIFSVGGSSGAVRFRDDGTAPTSNIGMRIPSGALPYLYQGNLHKLLFITDSVAGNAELNVTYVSVVD